MCNPRNTDWTDVLDHSSCTCGRLDECPPFFAAVGTGGLRNVFLRWRRVGSDDSLGLRECAGIHRALIPGEVVKRHPVFCSPFYIPVTVHEENYLLGASSLRQGRKRTAQSNLTRSPDPKPRGAQKSPASELQQARGRLREDCGVFAESRRTWLLGRKTHLL